jgi:hypothetical protein
MADNEEHGFEDKSSTIYQGWVESYMRSYGTSREVAEHAISEFYRQLGGYNNG